MGTVQKRYKVTFHRTYEVPEKLVWEREPDFTGYEDDKELIMEGIAEAIARDWLSDEMPEFLDNTQDFVSATVEVL